jgi:hypothetical protein
MGRLRNCAPPSSHASTAPGALTQSPIVYENATIRLAAVQAIESLRDPEVDALLAHRLGSEDRANVRRVVTDALAERPYTEVGRRTAVALAESNEEASTRIAAIELLGLWRSHDPELGTLLRKLERDEQDEKVRKAARHALGIASTAGD